MGNWVIESREIATADSCLVLACTDLADFDEQDLVDMIHEVSKEMRDLGSENVASTAVDVAAVGTVDSAVDFDSHIEENSVGHGFDSHRDENLDCNLSAQIGSVLDLLVWKDWRSFVFFEPG